MTLNHRCAVAEIDHIRSGLNQFFEKEASQSNDRFLSRTHRQRRDLVLSIVANELSRLKRTPAQCTALDFGCGAGVFVEALSRMGIRVTGVDRSQAMIEAARSRLGTCTTAQLEWLADDSMENAIYLRRSYDLILCLSVLEFTANPKEILARLAGLLTVGGLLIVTVPNGNSYLRDLERVGFRRPRLSRWIPGLTHLAQPDCYLKHQRQQFAAEALVDSASSLGLELAERRFHVAPKLCGAMERLEKVGMMILLSFRKTDNIANTHSQLRACSH
jgi:2-polyprenyl-3-methyl-5-hydroxy-6-metoxy-1,4-benzoquinol methylase